MQAFGLKALSTNCRFMAQNLNRAIPTRCPAADSAGPIPAQERAERSHGCFHL